MALLEFLKTNEKSILASIEEKHSALAGVRPPTVAPRSGLPIFFKQLLHVLEQAPGEVLHVEVDQNGLVRAANDSDEPAIAAAAGRHYEVEVARSAGDYGKELQQQG